MCQTKSVGSKMMNIKSHVVSFEFPILEHNWVTVRNPNNYQMVLQACDHCGVVKSENSVVKSCSGDKSARLISNLVDHSIAVAS